MVIVKCQQYVLLLPKQSHHVTTARVQIDLTFKISSCIAFYCNDMSS